MDVNGKLSPNQQQMCNNDQPSSTAHSCPEHVKPQGINKKKKLTIHNVVHLSVGHAPEMNADNVGVELVKSEVKLEPNDCKDVDKDPLEENSVFDNVQSADSSDDFKNIVKEEKTGDSTHEEVIRILEGDDEDEFESDEEMEIDEQVHNDNYIMYWSSQITSPVLEKFDERVSGLISTVTMNTTSPELLFFEHFCDQDLVLKIVDFTNKCHHNHIRSTDLRKYSRLHRWQDVTIDDIWIFLAVTMLFTRNKRQTIEEHWSSDPLLHIPIFHKTMCRDRYCSILAMLSFHDVNANVNVSKMHRVKMIIDHARQKFKSTYIPGRKLRIDKGIVPFKRKILGVKLFVLCDVDTGFIIDFIVHCGLETKIAIISNLGLTGSVVTELVKDYYFFNRELYMDNCYSSPQLFLYLKEKGIYACGTVKPHRKGMPTFGKLKRGQSIAYSSPPLLALKWQDKEPVTMLSTLHDDKIIRSENVHNTTGLPKLTPQCVVDHTKNMGSVDTSDMMMSTLDCIRNTKKWHKKFAFHVFDMLLLNAFYTYKIVNKKQTASFADFQMNVIKQILEKYSRPIVDTIGPTTSRDILNPVRVLPSNVIVHFPARTPNRKFQRCKVCAAKKKRSETQFMCKECNVYLCVVPCAVEYHTQQHAAT